MKIAFIILAYKNPSQLRELVESLLHEDHFFYIHIDKEKNIEPFEAELNKLPVASNIIYLSRQNSYWGSFQCVKVMLNGLTEAFDSKQEFDYFIHLSGQDFPVVSTNKIREQLTNSIPYSYFYNFAFEEGPWTNKGRDRIYSFQFFIGKKRFILHRQNKNPILKFLFNLCHYFAKLIDKGRAFYGGEFYFMLHRTGVKVLLENVKSNFIFSKRLKYTLIPEEIFIPTMLFQKNKKGREHLIKNNTLRYINWAEAHSSPKILDKTDLAIINGKEYLFARKFDFETYPEILAELKLMRL